MEDPLDPAEARVLGALIEKQYATPDNYPLTLNALVLACNQTSNRDPVMHLDEREVTRGLGRLTNRGLARAVHRGDSRVMRYRQEMGDRLHLHQPELAVLCVLLLRGPQTAGEIRTRSSRLFEFVDPKHVEVTLDSLMGLSVPLVTQLPRRPGQKEARYANLLGGEPAVDADATKPASSESENEDPAKPPPPSRADRLEALEDEVRTLREEVTELRAELEAFRRAFE